MFSHLLKYKSNTHQKGFVVLYSECHQGQHLHCLHSLKVHVLCCSAKCLVDCYLLCLLTKFFLVVDLFVIYQPSCQGVTIVSPSPPVGGTPCRLSTSVTCQTSWACSGGQVQSHQVVSWHVLVHAFYSSNPDPQHHARVWMSFQQNSKSNF